MSNIKIPHCLHEINNDDILAVGNLLGSQWLSNGPECRNLENRITRLTRSHYAVAVNSCFSALFIASKIAIDRLDGDADVFMPAVSFIATPNASLLAGIPKNRLHFVDVDCDTLCISHSSLKSKASSVSPRRAIVYTVNMAGIRVNSSSIRRLMPNGCQTIIIEDSAHAISSIDKYGSNVGDNSDFACMSFYPTKLVTAGEGGILICRNPDDCESARSLAYHGQYSGKYGYEKLCNAPGYNFKMSDVEALLAGLQVDRLEAVNTDRQRVAARYKDGILRVKHPPFAPGREWQMYIVALSDRVRRDKFVVEMARRGIEVGVHYYPPLHRQSCYCSRHNELITADVICDKVATLPIYPKMLLKCDNGQARYDYVIDCANSILGEIG